MLIGVISDTHIPERASKVPEVIFDIFKDVDLILHAGDLVSLDILDELNEIAPTKCSQGNIDRAYGLQLPRSIIFDIEGIKVGLNHGEVYPRGDTQQLRYIALETEADVLITGHTHWPFIKEVNDVLLLNPGSPTVPRLSDPSVMILNVDNKKLDAEIVKIGVSTCKALNFKPELK